MSWLNFDNQEKGFTTFKLTAENIKANRGKRIVYLRHQDVDTIRGYAFPRYATIDKKYYSSLLIDNGNNSIDLRDVIECGIEIKTT